MSLKNLGSTRTKLETVLRQQLSQRMFGLWTMTWHEDRAISPGVPDLSFVMKGADCETGWLELKAVDDEPEYTHATLKIEPSQIEWMPKHAKVCPVYFLVAVGPVCYLIDGGHAKELSQMISYDQLRRIADIYFPRKQLREELSRALIVRTLRRR